MLVRLLAVIVLALGTLTTAAPAQAAGTPGCVTRAEFKAVHKGYSLIRVKSVFGTGGTRMSRVVMGGFSAEIRSYKTCALYSSGCGQLQRGPAREQGRGLGVLNRQRPRTPGAHRYANPGTTDQALRRMSRWTKRRAWHGQAGTMGP